jgi:VanZ family protein
MWLNWLDVRAARAALVLALLAITTLALIPQQDVPASSGWDKFDHWLAFFTLALLADRSAGPLRFWPRVVPLLVAYGIGIEIAQSLTPDRHADVLDVIADTIGVLIYAAARLLPMLRLPRVDGAKR